MGRARNVDKDIVKLKSSRDNHEKRLKLIEDALEEMVQTRIHHVDLHSEEEFTPPAGKRKKTVKVEKSSAEA